jgi:hypothetical protein
MRHLVLNARGDARCLIAHVETVFAARARDQWHVVRAHGFDVTRLGTAFAVIRQGNELSGRELGVVAHTLRK